MSETEHVVTFAAEDGHLVARCSCGWSHLWVPSNDIAPHYFGMIFWYGVKHTADVRLESG